MKRVIGTYAAAAASGVLLALAFPLVVPLVGLREVDPAGWLEPLAWIALVPAFLVLRAAPTSPSARASSASFVAITLASPGRSWS